ncbi:chitin deacetylase [Mortierella alpina]|nr:chitin deacetylase [Mortierella alpina]
MTFRALFRVSPLILCGITLCILGSLPSSYAVLNPADFPKESEVPDVTHIQVQEWLREIDLSGAPSIEANSGDPPDCPSEVPEGVCYWTCEDCSADDVIECPDKNVWGITFDDGPTEATPELLAYLDEKQVKATFFLIGANVVKAPDMVKREAEAGHHLASHTWSHHALTTLTNEQIVAEIKWTEKAIEDATGYRVRYMRPPYGDVDNRVRYVLKKLGYVVVDWGGDTFDSNDWKIPEMSSSAVVSKFQKSLQAYTTPGANNTKGFISLEHDLTKETVAVAKAVIPFGMERNLRLMTVAQCLKDLTPYANSPVPPTSTVSAQPPPANNNGGTHQEETRGRVDASGLDLNQLNGAAVLVSPTMGQRSAWCSSLAMGLLMAALAS